ncbi:MAG TPA: hypothetical protein VJ729_11465 [Nitrososphaeraceae archaeon]|nr:hypothetical protein [Nitrososphaeraceae archaeon]
MNIDVDSPNDDKGIIINSFMQELCRLDNEANTGHRHGNEATVEEIRHRVLRAYSLEYIIPFLREHRLENKGDEPFEFLDEEQRVRLTDAGRNRCGQYGL